jgi:hypothetical protein
MSDVGKQHYSRANKERLGLGGPDISWEFNPQIAQIFAD